MADVQLEGLVRIPSSMLEAMLHGPLTGTQLRIVLVLVGLVQRTSSRNVCISQPDLAVAAGVPLAGGFRAALHRLEQAGVIRTVARARGRRGATYTVCRVHEWRTHPAV